MGYILLRDNKGRSTWSQGTVVKSIGTSLKKWQYVYMRKLLKSKDIAEIFGVSVKTLPTKGNGTGSYLYYRCFSCKVNGLRKYKNKLKGDDEL